MCSQLSTCLQETLHPWLKISVENERRYVYVHRKTEDGRYEYISMAAPYVRNLLYINSGVVSLWGDILAMHLNTGERKLETIVRLLAEMKEEDIPYYSNLYRSMLCRFLSARVFGLSPMTEWRLADIPETMLRLAPFDKKFVYEIIYNRYGYEDYLFRKTLFVE